MTRALHLGATALSIPTAGNAGNAMAAYAARAGLEAKVFMPRDVKTPFIRECELYGADVTLVDGLITDAGRMAAEHGKAAGWYDVSTLKEPYRIEGKKTMGYEVAEQLDWTLPDWIIYPTGGGTGMVGMWKAFAEMSALGWIDPVQAAAHGDRAGRRLRADRPRVRRGRREGRRCGRTRTRSPTACACRRRSATSWCCAPCARAAARRSPSATPTWSPACATSAALEGISAAPEGGAALHALRVLVARGPHQAARHASSSSTPAAR